MVFMLRAMKNYVTSPFIVLQNVWHYIVLQNAKLHLRLANFKSTAPSVVEISFVVFGDAGF